MKTKIYVITGSTSGIGNELIKSLADENIIFAGYRNEMQKPELEKLSPNIYPFYVDYSKPETIKKSTDYILSKCTKIDTIVNIAGCVIAGPVESLEMDEVRRQFNVNVFGHIELTQRLMSNLENGKIINVSSMASFGLFPFISPYCASKKCLDMFFNSLLIENKKNIKVVSIKPGVIATPLWTKSIEENSKYIDKYREYSKEMNYVLLNAQKNQSRGLKAKDVVKVILKADSLKNPRLSYTVGFDAFFASIIAKLPQKLINYIIKIGIKFRIK